jgi:hypothetical protein
LKTGKIAGCFHNFGKVFRDRLRLKINLRIDTKFSEQPFITKLVIPSSPTDLVGSGRCIALRTSESEAGTVDKTSID